MSNVETPCSRPRPLRRWLAFVLWVVLIFVLVPFANELQAAIAERFGAAALRWAVAGALAAAVVVGSRWLIGERRRHGAAIGPRLLWILAVAALAGAWLWRLRFAAEPAHLLFYAVLAVLAFRALCCRLRDRGVYPAAAALVAIVGILDEIVQWLVPGRFFDLGDLGIDVAAAVLVQLVIWQGVRPRTIAPGLEPRSLRAAARLTAAAALLLLLCLSNTPARIEWYAARVPGMGYLGADRSTRMIEYGHLFADPEIGRFTSRLSPSELARADRERGAEAARLLDRYRGRWGELDAAHPPWRAPLVAEARGHLFHRARARARALGERDPAARRRLATRAWRENLILERYFPHTLRLSGRGWKPAVRGRFEELHQPQAEFVSGVGDWLVTGFSETQARFGLLAVLAALAIVDRRAARRDR